MTVCDAYVATCHNVTSAILQEKFSNSIIVKGYISSAMIEDHYYNLTVIIKYDSGQVFKTMPIAQSEHFHNYSCIFIRSL